MSITIVINVLILSDIVLEKINMGCNVQYYRYISRDVINHNIYSRTKLFSKLTNPNKSEPTHLNRTLQIYILISNTTRQQRTLAIKYFIEPNIKKVKIGYYFI